MPPKRPHSLSPTVPDSPIFRSHPIHDRASTFIATFSPGLASNIARILQADPAFADASHRILAWRLPSTQQSLTPSRPIYTTGHDDDGEQHAGRKLETLLITLNVIGTVCVARWWGGIMLGPVRFAHIEGCAKEAINLARAGAITDQVPVAAKRQKVGGALDEAKRKADLIKVLSQRDESITVLRGLLAEKQGREKSEARAAPDYGKMGLAVLEKLDKARDATIAWVLKELDKAEEEVRIRDEGDELAEVVLSSQQNGADGGQSTAETKSVDKEKPAAEDTEDPVGVTKKLETTSDGKSTVYRGESPAAGDD